MTFVDALFCFVDVCMDAFEAKLKVLRQHLPRLFEVVLGISLLHRPISR